MSVATPLAELASGSGERGPGEPGPEEVAAAAEWLASRVVRTPLIRSPALDQAAGVPLWLKAENLQTTGSYKYRGALRAVDQVARVGGHAGVIAQSTGNHGLAVATAARRYGLSATVVLPEDAMPAKTRRIEATGARVIHAGTTAEERLAVAEQLRRSSGDAVIDAYDHPDVIAGQGSATLELIAQAARRGVRLDAVVLPVGGGGGIAGACLAAREHRPPAGEAQGSPRSSGRNLEKHGIAVYGVEPVGCDALGRSLDQGRRVTVAPAATLADGLRPSTVGELPWRIARAAVAGVVRVDDREIARALCQMLFHTALLLEPSAAAGLAGAMRIAASGSHANIGVVLTGGNAEPEVVARVLADYVSRAGAGRRVI